jgi:hypothetical protein
VACLLAFILAGFIAVAPAELAAVDAEPQPGSTPGHDPA